METSGRDRNSRAEGKFQPKTVKISRRVLNRPVFLVCTVLDEGLHVLLTGGDRSHVGAVSVCEYKDGLCRVSGLLRAGHRDDVISRRMASDLAEAFCCTVTVCCGIHYDAIDHAGINEVIACAQEMTEELVHALREVLQTETENRYY